jgi:transcriptional regulator with XRE-family HTH domain
MKKTTGPADKYVGSRVRMARTLIGMSQEKLGDVLGLKRAPQWRALKSEIDR